MSQITVDGVTHRLSHERLCEVDALAEKENRSREEVFADQLKPKAKSRNKPRGKPSKKEA